MHDTVLVTMASGLEQVTESELAARVPRARAEAKWRGRLLIAGVPDLSQLLALRTIDNVYLHIGRFPVGRHKSDLAAIGEQAAACDVQSALARIGRRAAAASAFVNCSRTGKHTYSRFQAAQAVLDALVARHRLVPGTSYAHDLEFRLDILDAEALFSVRLTDPEYRFRGQRHFAAAAIRPSVAHALVWLSDPADSDVFLDPFCGSGTIVSERADYEAAAIVGSDISAQALVAARENVPSFVELQQWDACRLGMASGSVSKVVTNPPWGKQIVAPGGLADLYTGFVREMRRVLMPGGSAVVLTDQDDLLSAAAEQQGLAQHRLTTVSLHGMVATVWRLQAPA